MPGRAKLAPCPDNFHPPPTCEIYGIVFLRVYILLLCQQQAAALFLLIKSNHFSHAFSYTIFPSIRICFLYSCIHYLHKSHNIPLLPPKICLGFVFDFHVPGEIANNDYAVFWGVKEVHYGIYAGSELLSLLLLYLFYIATEKPHQGTVINNVYRLLLKFQPQILRF